ncbi:hypothetical protein DPMN_167334 [Dreissena polymorpha]|uniref:Neurotransmitter-gated ion-channel transmembrane domain-containing protein n=1 Tax=Dreissena polymorpha TaxID=45954 RepID=A0A9D4EZN1_DREPO|nr:hypothetical protein DPMN_167334 [Dreissena polymorpha]
MYVCDSVAQCGAAKYHKQQQLVVNVYLALREEYLGILIRSFRPHVTMWDILSTAARAVNTEESEVVFEIKLKRKPGFYIINIIVPVILLSILNTFSFVLPNTSGERANFSVTVFLSLAVFLTIVAASLPTNADSVSLLSVFFILMSASSTLMVAVSSASTINHPKHDEPPYWPGILGSVLISQHSEMQDMQTYTSETINVA